MPSIEPSYVIKKLTDGTVLNGSLIASFGYNFLNALPWDIGDAGIEFISGIDAWHIADIHKFLKWAEDSGLWDGNQLKVMQVHATLLLMTD